MGLEFNIDLDFDGLRARLAESEPEAIGKALEHVRGIAVAQTPIETGDLAAGAHVVLEGDGGYVSYKSPYAHRQHEEVTWHHEHGNAKFLENAVVSEAGTALQILGDAISDHL